LISFFSNQEFNAICRASFLFLQAQINEIVILLLKI
jgi:hypothetical protein